MQAACIKTTTATRAGNAKCPIFRQSSYFIYRVAVINDVFKNELHIKPSLLCNRFHALQSSLWLPTRQRFDDSTGDFWGQTVLPRHGAVFKTNSTQRIALHVFG
jgi:hypothetical protein